MALKEMEIRGHVQKDIKEMSEEVAQSEKRYEKISNVTRCFNEQDPPPGYFQFAAYWPLNLIATNYSDE